MRRPSIPGGLFATPAPTSPPALANLAAWFDYTDSSTVFSNSGGTIIATNGDGIRNVTNKGFDTVNVPFMNGFNAGTPAGDIVVLTNAVNGLQVLQNTVDSQSSTSVLYTASSTLAAMPNGGTLAAIVKRKSTVSQSNAVFPTSFSDFSIVGSTGNWSTEVANCGDKNTLKPLVTNEWVYVYCTCDSAGNATWRAAGQSEQSSSGNPFVSRANGIFLSPQNAHWGEILYWNTVLTAGEKSSFITYANTKYGGTLPFVV